MKILLTADCMGGVWTYALDLIRAAPEHSFMVATLGARPNPAQRAQIEALPNATLRVSDFKLEWMDNPWDDVAASGDWLLELEREFRPAIVHLNGFAHGAANFKAPKIVVAHSCVASWWRAVKGEDAPASWNRYRELVAAGLRGADIIISPTRALLDEMNEIYGEFAPSRVIYNGSPDVATSRREVEPFVLSAGRLWDEAKNVALLEQIAPAVEAPICVAGEGGDLHNVEALGFLPFAQMSEQMERAAIWAHPARYEPFGLAVLEAANRNCALVLSDIPTLRELWQDAAIFVKSDDDEGWTNALNRLLCAPAERDNWASKAKSRASRYSLERFGAGYAEVYEALKSR